MLFAVKRHIGRSLLLAGLFLACWWTGRYLSDRNVDLSLSWPFLLFGFLLLAGSDGGLHLTLIAAGGQEYVTSYRAFVLFFQHQGPSHVLAAAVLAGTEELFFRGLLLEGLLRNTDLSVLPAIGFTGLVFGALHYLPVDHLRLFGLWAVWEGILLSGIYVLSGSLLLCIVLHSLHDAAGFTIFIIQRKTGWGIGLAVKGSGRN